MFFHQNGKIYTLCAMYGLTTVMRDSCNESSPHSQASIGPMILRTIISIESATYRYTMHYAINSYK